MDVPTLCPSCDGKGCEDCLHLGFIGPLSQATKDCINALFYKKLAEHDPNHPWLKRRNENG